MSRGGRDPRLKRDRGSEDPVFTYDDWERGFQRYQAMKEDKGRERFTGDSWRSYRKWKEWLKSRDPSKDKWTPKGYRNEEEEFQHQDYQYRVDMDRFIRGKIPIPPPKPPWLAGSNEGRTGGTEFYDIKSDPESFDDKEYMSSEEEFSEGTAPSVPSWARSDTSHRSKYPKHRGLIFINPRIDFGQKSIGF